MTNLSKLSKYLLSLSPEQFDNLAQNLLIVTYEADLLYKDGEVKKTSGVRLVNGDLMGWLEFQIEVFLMEDKNVERVDNLNVKDDTGRKLF